jgi:plasmid maintenance system killer protein
VGDRRRFAADPGIGLEGPAITDEHRPFAQERPAKTASNTALSGNRQLLQNPCPFRHPLGSATGKLDMVNAAHELQDLKVPPGNRLEALKGELRGKLSIRINDQWRVIFRWETEMPTMLKSTITTEE